MRQSVTLPFLVFLLFVTISCKNSSTPEVPTIAYVGVHVIPMDTDEILRDHVLIVKDNKIDQLLPREKFQPSKSTTVIDAHGKFLLPGMSEFHSHIPTAPEGDFSNAQETMWLYLMHGVLTVRGMIGHPSHLELIQKIKQGEISGPRIFAAGPSLNGNSVPDPATGASMVREQAAAGYHHLKLHPGLDVPKFEAIAAAAKEAGIYFGGHVSADVGLERCLRGGYRSVEHMDGYIEALVTDKAKLDPATAGPFGIYLTPYIDGTLMSDLAMLTKESGTWIVATQSLFERWFGPRTLDQFRNEPEFELVSVQMRGTWFNNRRVFENGNPDYTLINDYINFRRELIKLLHDSGVGFVLGSDSPQVFNVPGYSVYHELEAMQRCGLSPYEVLRTGSVNAAAYFGQEGIFGVIRPGAEADFVLLNSDPLVDVANFRTLEGISVQGKYYNKVFLDSIRTEITARHAGNE